MRAHLIIRCYPNSTITCTVESRVNYSRALQGSKLCISGSLKIVAGKPKVVPELFLTFYISPAEF